MAALDEAHALAAICRQVVMAKDGGTIPCVGDGSVIRAYTYEDDPVDELVLGEGL